MSDGVKLALVMPRQGLTNIEVKYPSSFLPRRDVQSPTLRGTNMGPKRVLVIAGSDSSGGA